MHTVSLFCLEEKQVFTKYEPKLTEFGRASFKHILRIHADILQSMHVSPGGQRCNHFSNRIACMFTPKVSSPTKRLPYTGNLESRNSTCAL